MKALKNFIVREEGQDLVRGDASSESGEIPQPRGEKAQIFFWREQSARVQHGV